MSEEKFIEQNDTVLKFINIFCDNHHKVPKSSKDFELVYNGKFIKTMHYNLCPECESMFFYSNARLINCPHEVKPKCRKCPHICYDKEHLKMIAKIMRSSAISLGLSKITSIFKKNA